MPREHSMASDTLQIPLILGPKGAFGGDSGGKNCVEWRFHYYSQMGVSCGDILANKKPNLCYAYLDDIKVLDKQ